MEVFNSIAPLSCECQIKKKSAANMVNHLSKRLTHIVLLNFDVEVFEGSVPHKIKKEPRGDMVMCSKKVPDVLLSEEAADNMEWLWK